MKATSSNDLNLILEKIRPNCFKLWACRGEGRGCSRNKYRKQKVHCEDCVEADDAETIGQLKDRLERKG